MINRKYEDKTPKIIESPWSKDLVDLLSKTYKSQMDSDKIFKIYPMFYPGEFVVAFSYGGQGEHIANPATYLISVDLLDDAPSKDILNAIVDASGHFFDDFFSSDADFSPSYSWTEQQMGKIQLWHLTSRENLDLYFAAQELLDGNEESFN